MLDVIKGFAEQVTEYSTLFGQLWYICAFLFRGIVVVTIGGDVYSDEQSAFKCSTKIVGCRNICFTNFSKISHIRFWAFQLLAVSTPPILFHFFVAGVKTRLARMNELAVTDSANGEHPHERYSPLLHSTRRGSKQTGRMMGRVRMRSVYDTATNNLKQVTFTDSIYAAYFINVILRLAIEGIFIYLSYDLFKFPIHTHEQREYGPLDFVWFSVPGLYLCQGPEVASSCNQHVVYSQGGYVSCWVSRPWEKTIFLRYMNILSCLCFLLSALELIYITAHATKTACRWGIRKSRPLNGKLLLVFPRRGVYHTRYSSQTMLSPELRRAERRAIVKQIKFVTRRLREERDFV